MSKNSIYKSPNGKQIILDLYDKHLNNLQIDFEEKSVHTRYGKTHIIITGKKDSCRGGWFVTCRFPFLGGKLQGKCCKDDDNGKPHAENLEGVQGGR